MPKKSVRKSRGPQKKASRKKTVGGASTAGQEPGSGDGKVQPPDLGPFDARFFESQFPNLLPPKEKRDGPPAPQPYVVTVVLGDGMVQLEIAQIDELSNEWALFELRESPGQRDGGGPSRFVFVPYGAIARVEVSGSESNAAAIGFHRKPVEKKKKKTAPKAGGRRKAVVRKAARKKAAPRKRA